MDNFEASQPLIRGTVAEVLDANNEDLKAFVKNFKIEHRKQWMSTASAILKSAGICGNIVDILQIRDLCELDECVSPVRKKQKSNDFDKSLPAVAQSSTEPPKIHHGLSDAELGRINKLKRADLMKELDKIGGEYHKTWPKGDLVHALLSAYANIHLPSTQVVTEKDDPTIKSTVKKPTAAIQKRCVISDYEIINLTKSSPVVPTTDGEHIQKHKNSAVARSIADAEQTMNGKNEIIEITKSNSLSSVGELGTAKSTSLCVDDCQSVLFIADPSNVVAASITQEVSNMDVDEPLTIHDLIPTPCTEVDDDDDDIFESAKENFSQSQHSQFKQNVVTKYYTPSLPQIPGSDVKPPRSSPSVPVGIVDSVKKQLLSSQKKAQTLKSQNLARTIGPQKLDLEQKAESVNLDMSLPNKAMAMPAFDNGYAPLNANSGFSEKVKASKEARNERIAQVKALSKLTCQKTIPSTAQAKLTSSGAKKITSKNTILPYAKLDPKDRFAELRAKHHNQKHFDQSMQSVGTPIPVDEIQNDFSKKVTTIKSKSPKRAELNPPEMLLEDEFLSYEMTDGEYDSDDDDASQRRKFKRIPDWARTTNLGKALEVQYSEDYLIDPDELFGEVETCNLEAIFGLPLPKYRHRNSSGDWTKHRVTSEEKRMYRRYVTNSKAHR